MYEALSYYLLRLKPLRTRPSLMRGKSAQLIEFDNTTAASIPSCSYADEGRKPCLTRGKNKREKKRLLRQYLYFCTEPLTCSSRPQLAEEGRKPCFTSRKKKSALCVSICTFCASQASTFVLVKKPRKLRSTSSATRIISPGSTAASAYVLLY